MNRISPDEFNLEKLIIRQAFSNDDEDVMDVERQAFGEEDEAILVDHLLKDSSAQPTISLLACYEERAVGHLLYTSAKIKGHDKWKVYILAPLAVVPEFQKLGIGQQLMKAGDKLLIELHVDLVFVLGHPSYYPKNGFINDAKAHGFPAPYPIPDKDSDAWMFKKLKDVPVSEVAGKILCCEAMDRAEYWRE